MFPNLANAATAEMKPNGSEYTFISGQNGSRVNFYYRSTGNARLVRPGIWQTDTPIGGKVVLFIPHSDSNLYEKNYYYLPLPGYEQQLMHWEGHNNPHVKDKYIKKPKKDWVAYHIAGDTTDVGAGELVNYFSSVGIGTVDQALFPKTGTSPGGQTGGQTYASGVYFNPNGGYFYYHNGYIYPLQRTETEGGLWKLSSSGQISPHAALYVFGEWKDKSSQLSGYGIILYTVNGETRYFAFNKEECRTFQGNPNLSGSKCPPDGIDKKNTLKIDAGDNDYYFNYVGATGIHGMLNSSAKPPQRAKPTTAPLSSDTPSGGGTPSPSSGGVPSGGDTSGGVPGIDVSNAPDGSLQQMDLTQVNDQSSLEVLWPAAASSVMGDACGVKGGEGVKNSAPESKNPTWGERLTAGLRNLRNPAGAIASSFAKNALKTPICEGLQILGRFADRAVEQTSSGLIDAYQTNNPSPEETGNLLLTMAANGEFGEYGPLGSKFVNKPGDTAGPTQGGQAPPAETQDKTKPYIAQIEAPKTAKLNEVYTTTVKFVNPDPARFKVKYLRIGEANVTLRTEQEAVLNLDQPFYTWTHNEPASFGYLALVNYTDATATEPNTEINTDWKQSPQAIVIVAAEPAAPTEGAPRVAKIDAPAQVKPNTDYESVVTLEGDLTKFIVGEMVVENAPEDTVNENIESFVATYTGQPMKVKWNTPKEGIRTIRARITYTPIGFEEKQTTMEESPITKVEVTETAENIPNAGVPIVASITAPGEVKPNTNYQATVSVTLDQTKYELTKILLENRAENATGEDIPTQILPFSGSPVKFTLTNSEAGIRLLRAKLIYFKIGETLPYESDISTSPITKVVITPNASETPTNPTEPTKPSTLIPGDKDGEMIDTSQPAPEIMTKTNINISVYGTTLIGWTGSGKAQSYQVDVSKPNGLEKYDDTNQPYYLFRPSTPALISRQIYTVKVRGFLGNQDDSNGNSFKVYSRWSHNVRITINPVANISKPKGPTTSSPETAVVPAVALLDSGIVPSDTLKKVTKNTKQVYETSSDPAPNIYLGKRLAKVGEVIKISWSGTAKVYQLLITHRGDTYVYTVDGSAANFTPWESGPYDISVRAVMGAKLSDDNSTITFTYSKAFEPALRATIR